MSKAKPVNRRVQLAREILTGLVKDGKCKSTVEHLSHAPHSEFLTHMAQHGYEWTGTEWRLLHDDLTGMAKGQSKFLTVERAELVGITVKGFNVTSNGDGSYSTEAVYNEDTE